MQRETPRHYQLSLSIYSSLSAVHYSLHKMAVLNLRRYTRHLFSAIQQYRMKWVVIVASIWTIVDLLSKIIFSGTGRSPGTNIRILTPQAAGVRFVVVFACSLAMAWFLVFRLRTRFRQWPLWRNLLAKLAILIMASVFVSFLVHFTYTTIVWKSSLWLALVAFWHDATETTYLFEKTMAWMALYLLTLLMIEINEKYSPGLFFAILFGRYVKPQQERRIVMFLDLKDSTPIAEALGHVRYFSFIRDFIFYVSTAILEYNGRIYQYVGDEIVTSWPSTRRNAQKCFAALLEARRQLQGSSEEFRRKYGYIPEFRCGIHDGLVTIGEIGVVKKDLAMSGDTMNTAARIRSACSELNRKFLVSKDIRALLPLQDFQVEDMGPIDLKGKSGGIELFSLRV